MNKMDEMADTLDEARTAARWAIWALADKIDEMEEEDTLDEALAEYGSAILALTDKIDEMEEYITSDPARMEEWLEEVNWWRRMK